MKTSNQQLHSSLKPFLLFFLLLSSLLLVTPGLSAVRLLLVRNLAHLELVELLMNPGVYNDALVYQTEFRLIESRSWRNHGFLLDTMGHHDKAQLSYAKQLNQNPDLLASYFLGLGHFTDGEAEEAAKIWQLVDSDRIAQRLCQQLDSAMKSQDRKQINSLANQLILVAPNYFYAQYCAGRGYAATGQQLMAIAAFEQAIQIGTNDKRSLLYLYWQKGDIHMGLSEWEAAVVAYRYAVKLAPDNAEVRANLGLALAYAGDYSLAKQELLDAIQIDPQSIRPYQRLGNLYQQQGDYEEAAYWFSQARAADSTSSIPLRELGILALSSQGNPNQAQEYFQQAIDLEPDLRVNWFWLGRVHTNLRQWDDMETAFRQAFILSETTNEKVEVLTELAQGFSDNEQADHALSVWQEVIALDPENSQAQEAINRLQTGQED